MASGGLEPGLEMWEEWERASRVREDGVTGEATAVMWRCGTGLLGETQARDREDLG